MKKKMHGIIDPYTLGFLISLIGGTTVLVANSNGDNMDVSLEQASTTEVVVVKPENKDVIE